MPKKLIRKHKSMGLHDKWMQKRGVYARWHKHPLQSIAQWVILLAVVGGVGYLLLNRMNDPLAQNYGLESSADNGDGGPQLFLGAAVEKKKSKHGSVSQEIDGIDADKLEMGAQKFELQLPEDRTVSINLKNIEKRKKGDSVWRGKVQDREDSAVSLTLKNGFVAGVVSIGGDMYEIKPSVGKNKKHILEKMDPKSFPAESDIEAPKDMVLSYQKQPAVLGSTSSDGMTQIDILTVYTPQAMSGAGGTAQIDSLIQAAVDYANTAFLNSQVNIHYNLVATAEVAYNDSGNTQTDLAWLTSSSQVANLRDRYGADLVSMVVGSASNACGTGYVMGQPNISFASYAFQVTAKDCAVGNLSFAHEHGHNLGMQHDPANAAGAYYAWSYGHAVDGVFRTVMSYSAACPSGCARVPYFSNPNVMYAGYPTGIANQRDNARTANLNASTVAAFRSSPNSTIIPAAPGAMQAVAVSSSQINLTWSDTSTDELGFKLERSVDGSSFTQIANIGANVINYYDGGLNSSTIYYYRVIAYNGAGDSSPSNTASATTQAPDLTAPTVNITKPLNGAKISSRVDVQASASDNVGVARVEFYIDGKLSATDSSAPYTYRWNVNRKISNGTHTIMAKAYDVAGNSASSSISVIK
jgi:hypothetical protein